MTLQIFLHPIATIVPSRTSYCIATQAVTSIVSRQMKEITDVVPFSLCAEVMLVLDPFR